MSLALPWLACSSNAGSQEVDPDQRGPFASDTGAFQAWLMNETIERGENTIELCLASSEELPQPSALVLEMSPFMPAMGHGSSGPRVGKALGDGCYAFSGIRLNMPGTWVLETTISGPVEDSLSPRLFVE